MEMKVCPCCGSEVVAFQSRAVPGGLDITGRCQTCGCAWDSAYATNDVADDLRCEFSLGKEFVAGWIDAPRDHTQRSTSRTNPARFISAD